MTTEAQNIKTYKSDGEKTNRETLLSLFKSCPIADSEILSNLGLFLSRQALSRVLLLNELYQKIVPVPGCVMEFGVQWGHSLALYESFRGIYEPYNYNRRIIGFDTFEGYPSVHDKDGDASIIHEGAYSTTEGYDDYLRQVLDCHEKESPVSHIQKYALIKGDATVEVQSFLDDNPETVIAFAYFDFGLYEPTRKCLEAIRPHLTKGAVLGFDELSLHDFPGETVALREVLGLDRYRLRRSPYSSVQSYLIIE